MGLVDDRPIASMDGDLLGRSHFARHIADQVAELRGTASLVVGLYGRWGEGKTSVLQMVEEALGSKEHVVPVRFNPWLYQGHSQLLLAFFETIAGALERSLRRGKKAASALRAIGGALGSVAIGAGPVTVSPGRAFEAAAQSLDTVDLNGLRRKVEGMLAEQRKRVVILIDDIDRLDDDEVAMLFKLVKLAADFDHTAYVLAMDEHAVARALTKRFAGDEVTGANFVEKIVQVPLRLPRASPALLLRIVLNDLQALLDDEGVVLPDEEVRRFSGSFQRHIAPHLGTPRNMKRFVNGVRFSARALSEEVNVVDLLLLEGLRAVFPTLHETVRNNRELALGSGLRSSSYRTDAAKEMVRRRFDPVLDSISDDRRQDARELLMDLFPKMKSVYDNYVFGPDSAVEWTRAHRVCSDEYFDRYFELAVPPGDVSSRDVRDLLQTVAMGELDQAVDSLRLLIQASEPERVIAKLREREADLTPDAARSLALVVSEVGEELPEYERGILGLASSPWTQAAIHISFLIGQIGPQDRLSASLESLDRASVSFASEVFRWMRVASSEEADERLLENDALDVLGRNVASRIAAENDDGALFERHGRRAPHLFWIWRTWGNSSDATAAVNAWLRQDPDHPVLVVRAFAAQGWELSTGAPTQASLPAETVEAIISHELDVDAMAEALRARYGEPEGDVDYDLRRIRDTDERLALEFQQRLSQRRRGGT